MKKSLIFLLILLLPPLQAMCESTDDRLSQLDLINQADLRFCKDVYRYSGNAFSGSGCMPSSILNALVSTMGNTQTDSAPLLLELLEALSVQDSYKVEPIQNHRLPEVLEANDRNTPHLNHLANQASHILETIVTDSPAGFVGQITKRGKPGTMVITRLEAFRNRRWLAALAQELTQAGHGDARIALSCLGVGTDDTPDAPFRVSGSGHYITLYFEAESFHQAGTFYLLDSYPRALYREKWGANTVYAHAYPFTQSSHHSISKLYAITRLTDVVIRFSLLPRETDKLDQIMRDSRHPLSQREQRRLDRREQQLEPLQVFGTAVMLLYIP